MKRTQFARRIGTLLKTAAAAAAVASGSAAWCLQGPTATVAVPAPGRPTATQFVNPLLPFGADPWITTKDGFYYYMNTTGNGLEIWKTRSIADLATAEHKVVWHAPASGPYSHDVWAPELHYLRHRWYIYFAADAGDNSSHRIWVVENAARDPLEGTWEMKGKVADATDRWAIDPTILQEHGRIYMLWSGWPGTQDGQQNIYIARLRNPWTVVGERVRISASNHSWEEVGDLPSHGRILAVPHVNVNEGPEILQHGRSVFLVYSASGCWTDYYELGMLRTSADADPLKPASWHKLDHPVFEQSPAAHAYGTGHNSFFRSPDGTQDWILYHANAQPDEGCGGDRAPRAQPFTWNPDGTPNFGRPVPLDQPILRPAGDSPSEQQ
jgi:GH43 family beta-xylosidase